MPEGDTVHLLARKQHAGLAGKRVTGVETRVPQIRALVPERLVGQVVDRVEARGKHLLHWFAPSALALHSHLRMTGSWRLYAPGQKPNLPAHQASLVLRTEDVVAVAFSMPVLELLSAAQVARHPQVATLGPDPLAPTTDLHEARRRLDTRAGVAIGEALLDQRVLAGVGNVYRNEVLFMHQVDPWSAVEEVPAEVLDGLLETLDGLLKANVAGGRWHRVTTQPAGDVARGVPLTGAALFVYGRAGRGCPRCGAAIRSARQGRHSRITYWCPRCQGPGPGTR